MSLFTINVSEPAMNWPKVEASRLESQQVNKLTKKNFAYDSMKLQSS